MISATLACSSLRQIKQLLTHQDRLYAVINNPDDSNRYQLTEILNQQARTVQPQLDCRSKLNGYGGGSIATGSSRLWIVDNNDLISLKDELEYSRESSITVGDLCTDSFFNRCLAILEKDDRQYIIDCQQPHSPLTSDADFYSSPTVAPDGRHMAYVTRSHPNMPWDNTELWITQLDSDGLPITQSQQRISRSQSLPLSEGESISQPLWRNNSQLTFISDRNEFWGCYCYDLNTAVTSALYTPKAEICAAAWDAGEHNLVLLEDGGLICSTITEGRWQLQRISAVGEVKVLSGHRCDSLCRFSQLTQHHNRIYFVGQSYNRLENVYALNLCNNKIETALVDTTPNLPLPAPTHYRFKNTDCVSYGYFYPPATHSAQPPALIIRAHGGPTSATTAALNLTTRYFNQHGFAVLDLNYRGSTGYGRRYRHSLYGEWGGAEVSDAIQAVKYLAAKRLINPAQVFARGNSAGGYMTLCLATFSQLLAGGTISAGISNLNLLAQHTHRFERHYIQQLLAQPLSTDVNSRWYQRSPIHFAGNISHPLLFIQGEQDTICPPQQALFFIEALRDKNISCDYLLFVDEQHGIKSSQNIREALLHELDFYQKIIIDSCLSE